MTLFVQSGRAGALVPEIRRILRDVDPRLAPTEIGVMPDLMRAHNALLDGITRALGTAGLMAIGMAAAGLFGIVSYGAAQRTHEFGVRLALGARSADIGRSLARESLIVVVVGAVAGLVLAAPATWLASQGLASARAADPSLVVLALAVLLLVSLAATVRPLRRVARIDPVAALRSD
jgi:ABC-type antimicrobial peptide transport system permease subunit